MYSGSTDVKDVYSPALEGNLQGNPSTQPVIVYLPPFYENFPENKYPVVYLLHQFTTDYNLYFEEFNIDEKLDRLISQKAIHPMIIATPNAYTIYEGSGFTNSYVSGNWEDYITIDVIQHIENNYAAIIQPESRGLAGFSSAGYGTLNIAMKHPSTFSSIGTIGAALLDIESFLLNDPGKSWIIAAAGNNASSSLPPYNSFQRTMYPGLWYFPCLST
jgi:S-formylglutathione hydrolase